jgi:hypothetical protein
VNSACRTCGGPLPALWVYRKGRRVKRQYCSMPCVPSSVRAAGGRTGRVQATHAARLRRFRDKLKQLQALERITGEELMATFAAIDSLAYHQGYSKCETKWLRRMKATERTQGEAA